MRICMWDNECCSHDHDNDHSEMHGGPRAQRSTQKSKTAERPSRCRAEQTAQLAVPHGMRCRRAHDSADSSPAEPSMAPDKSDETCVRRVATPVAFHQKCMPPSTRDTPIAVSGEVFSHVKLAASEEAKTLQTVSVRPQHQLAPRRQSSRMDDSFASRQWDQFRQRLQEQVA